VGATKGEGEGGADGGSISKRRSAEYIQTPLRTDNDAENAVLQKKVA
jgi:hypothetical protein